MRLQGGLPPLFRVVSHPLIRNQLITSDRKGDAKVMSGEIFNAAILAFTLIPVGLGLGFLLLKLQGGEE